MKREVAEAERAKALVAEELKECERQPGRKRKAPPPPQPPKEAAYDDDGGALAGGAPQTDDADTTFKQNLEAFHSALGTESVPLALPTFLGYPLELPDLHAIFVTVQEMGGYDCVAKNQAGTTWSRVCDLLGGARQKKDQINLMFMDVT